MVLYHSSGESGTRPYNEATTASLKAKAVPKNGLRQRIQNIALISLCHVRRTINTCFS
jgi:hypothetical protein